MLWFLVWVVLVVGAVAVLGLLGWSLFRRGLDLAREISKAAELLGQATAQVERIGDPAPAVEVAVFSDPHALRRSRRNAHRRGGSPPRKRRPTPLR